jgi:quercetin dioxygenase-like cupin family protein
MNGDETVKGKASMVQIVLTLGLVVMSGCASAPEQAESLRVVPAAEEELAAKKDLEGPTATRGIRSVTTIGTVELGSEFAAIKGRQLRSREIVVEPGGMVAVHEHDARPGMAYILEGEIFEHRNDQPGPILRRKGDAAFEQTGVSHWWENRSNQPVRALVVDIVPIE